RAFFHGDVCIIRRGSHELRLGAIDVYDRMEADRLRHHSAPARLERAHDVRFRFRRRRRRKQKGILELNPGKSYRSIHSHTASKVGDGAQWLFAGRHLLSAARHLLSAALKTSSWCPLPCSTSSSSSWTASKIR